MDTFQLHNEYIVYVSNNKVVDIASDTTNGKIKFYLTEGEYKSKYLLGKHRIEIYSNGDIKL